MTVGGLTVKGQTFAEITTTKGLGEQLLQPGRRCPCRIARAPEVISSSARVLCPTHDDSPHGFC